MRMFGNCVGHTSTGNLVGLLRCIFLLKFLVCGEYKLEKRLDIRPEIQYPAIRYPEIGLDINSAGRTAGKISIRCDLDLFQVWLRYHKNISAGEIQHKVGARVHQQLQGAAGRFQEDERGQDCPRGQAGQGQIPGQL